MRYSRSGLSLFNTGSNIVKGVKKMAKKRTQTAYTRNRERIMRQLRRERARGKETFLPYIPTERELRKQGVKGKELSALTRELKKITPKKIREYTVAIDIIEIDFDDTWKSKLIEIIEQAPDERTFYHKRVEYHEDYTEKKGSLIKAIEELYTNSKSQAEDEAINRKIEENLEEITMDVDMWNYDSNQSRVEDAIDTIELLIKKIGAD